MERSIYVIYEVYQSLYMDVQTHLGNALVRYFSFSKHRYTLAAFFTNWWRNSILQLKTGSQEAGRRAFLDYQNLAQTITFAFAWIDSLTIRFMF